MLIDYSSMSLWALWIRPPASRPWMNEKISFPGLLKQSCAPVVTFCRHPARPQQQGPASVPFNCTAHLGGHREVKNLGVKTLELIYIVEKPFFKILLRALHATKCVRQQN